MHRYKRSKKPPPMRFQKRDGEILQTIFDYDGVLARRHIKEMFWPDKSRQAMERRLTLLFHNGYINLPSQEQRRTKAIPEPIVWLGWSGALWLAGKSGIVVDPPKNDGENQMRLLDKRLRDQGFRWLREPRWSQLEHDLAIVDFRLAVEKSVSKIPHVALEEWIPEGVWLTDHDVIEYKIKGARGKSTRREKGVRPDGYFSIVDHKRKIKGNPVRYRFLLEIDMSTHPNPRFGKQKAIPNVAYIRSPEYKDRFGYQSGRWLVVTTGDVRMEHLMRQTKRDTGSDAKVFLFTTFAHLKDANVVTAPIWHQVGNKKPRSLFQPSK